MGIRSPGCLRERNDAWVQAAIAGQNVKASTAVVYALHSFIKLEKLKAFVIIILIDASCVMLLRRSVPCSSPEECVSMPGQRRLQQRRDISVHKSTSVYLRTMVRVLLHAKGYALSRGRACTRDPPLVIGESGYTSFQVSLNHTVSQKQTMKPTYGRSLDRAVFPGFFVDLGRPGGLLLQASIYTAAIQCADWF